jgi:Mrp family chromosome partitioning ATPase
MTAPVYPTPARSHTGSFRVPREELGSGASRTQLSAMWAAARARNALRRRWHFTSVSAAALVLSLVTITLLPRQAARLASLAAPRPGEKVDTLALAADAAAMRQAFISADSALQTKRDAALRAHAAAVAAVQARRAAEALAAGGAARRDSLSAAVADLDRLIARAQTSPLPTSYRALADVPGLREDPRVRAMIDSLDDVEREREAFGVVSGVDPVYVQLTNAINRYGRVIEGIADRQRAALRDQLAALGDPSAGGAVSPVPGVVPAAPVVPTVPAVDSALPVVPQVAIDTAADAAAIQRARLRRDSADAKLAAARARNVAVDRRVEAARARANVEAPPSAMLVSAFALALVIGFSIMLSGEVRRPRVADAREAERVSRTRVLAVVRPESSISDRARRAADEEIGGLIDSSIESYRMLYLSLAATGAAIPIVAVTGDDPAIAATVAANVAAVAAEDGRSTLVVDSDMGRGLLSTALGVRSRTGLSDIARSNLPLAEAIVPVTVGRGLTIDVVPAGVAPPPPTVATATASAAVPVVGGFDTLRLDLGRLTRRYDFAVLGMPPSEAEADARGFRIAPDVIVCARAGHTPLAGLALEVERLQQAGARVRGLVLWDDERPSLDET